MICADAPMQLNMSVWLMDGRTKNEYKANSWREREWDTHISIGRRRCCADCSDFDSDSDSVRDCCESANAAAAADGAADGVGVGVGECPPGRT